VLIGGALILAWLAQRPAPIVIAFASSLSGPSAATGREALAATRIYLDEVNAAGGIDGHKLQLALFDDQGLPPIARDRATRAVASPALAVLGHALSATSNAAGPLYREGRIAAVTGSASSDATTRDNPWFFCALSPNSQQAEFLAEYVRAVVLAHNSNFMRTPDIDFVATEDSYGRNFLDGYARGNGGVAPKTFTIRVGEHADGGAAATADLLAQEPEPRIIVLGTAPDVTAAALKAIRRRGIHSIVILASRAASDSFVEQFAAEPEERDEPGFFLDNVFAIAPMILDSTGELGQAFAARYHRETGARAGWVGAAAEDATRVVVEAIRRAHVADTDASRADDREKVRAALAAMTDPATAPLGINGPLYFDANRQMPRPIRYGFFRKDRFISAPLQLVRVQNPELIDVVAEMDAGHIVQIGDLLYWLQRVVYTGIDITHLDRIDVRNGSFAARFFLWMRYAGSDDLPTQVAFPDLDGDFNPAHPAQSGTEEGLNYRLYDVSGTFKARYDLHDFPFDRQSPVIRLQNRDHPREQVAYVIDTFGLQTDRTGAASDGTASDGSAPDGSAPDGSADAFRDLQLWHVLGVQPFAASVSIRSTLGKPALFETANRVEYGAYATEIVLERNAVAFMVKTLIPLFLLVLVVFVTFFFPETLAEERTTIPITAILTSAVLLISIGSDLPGLGYTVAVEYLFYVFFGLCLMAMFVGFLTEHLRLRAMKGHRDVIDTIGIVTYCSVVAITAGVFWWKYGARL